MSYALGMKPPYFPVISPGESYVQNGTTFIGHSCVVIVCPTQHLCAMLCAGVRAAATLANVAAHSAARARRIGMMVCGNL